jgi:hypothetical protein
MDAAIMKCAETGGYVDIANSHDYVYLRYDDELMTYTIVFVKAATEGEGDEVFTATYIENRRFAPSPKVAMLIGDRYVDLVTRLIDEGLLRLIFVNKSGYQVVLTYYSDVSGQVTRTFTPMNLNLIECIAIPDDYMCPICQMDEDEKLCRTKCNHIFHASCLRVWIRKNDSCPLCREPVMHSG